MKKITVEVLTDDVRDTKPAACVAADAICDAGLHLESANVRATSRGGIELTFWKLPK